MTRDDNTFEKVVFGLTWLFIIMYGSYNIGASIVRHEWPKPLVIVGAVVIALVGSLILIKRAEWRRNVQENERPAVPAKRPPPQGSTPTVTYRGNSVYVQDPPERPS
jgi:hypothetical protein